MILSAAAFLLADVAILWIGTQRDFAFDFTCCYQQAAARALEAPSTLYEWSDTYTFRYTPIGALLFAPLVPLPPDVAAWAWLGTKLVILAVAAAWLAQGWPRDRRALIIGLVLLFPPVIHDLVIGNVSTLTLLVLIAVARWPGVRSGIAIGLLTVLMPKPHLIPVLAFLVVTRRRDALVAVATVVTGTAVGLAIFGPDPWLAFIGTLREPLERTFTANVGWSSLLGPAGVIIGLVLAAVAFAAAVLVGGSRGYGLSIISGILAGPYTFIHYLAGTLVAAEPVLRTQPRRLWPFPWLIVYFPLIPVWLTALGLVLAAPRDPQRETEPAEGVPQGAGPG